MTANSLAAKKSPTCYGDNKTYPMGREYGAQVPHFRWAQYGISERGYWVRMFPKRER